VVPLILPNELLLPRLSYHTTFERSSISRAFSLRAPLVLAGPTTPFGCDGPPAPEFISSRGGVCIASSLTSGTFATSTTTPGWGGAGMGGLANDTRPPPENAPSTEGGGQGLLQWRVEHAGSRQDVDSQRRGSWSGGQATNNPDGGWGVRDTAVEGHIPEALAGKGYLTINSSLPLLSKSSTSMPVTPADSSRADSPLTSASSSAASSLVSDAAASCHSAPVAMQVRRNKSCPHNTVCHCHPNPSITPFSHPSANAPTNSATKQAMYSPTIP